MRTSPRSRRCFAALAFGCWLSLARSASADLNDPAARAAARALANEAANAFAARDYARAHELCERAYAVVPAPTIALLDARSLVRLRRFVDAEQAYARAIDGPLASSRSGVFQKAAGDARAERQALLPRIPKLKVVLDETARARKLTVLLDRRALPESALGTWMLLDPRRYAVQVAGHDRVESSEDVTLAEGDSRVLLVRAPEKTPKSSLRAWGYVGVGAGVAAVTTGIVTGAIAMDARDEATRLCSDGQCEPNSRGSDAVERFRTYRAISTVGYAVGAAAATFGVVALFWPRDRAEPDVSVGASLGGLWIEGRL